MVGLELTDGLEEFATVQDVCPQLSALAADKLHVPMPEAEDAAAPAPEESLKKQGTSRLGRAEREVQLKEVDERLTDLGKDYLKAISDGVIGRERKAKREEERKEAEKADLAETYVRQMKREVTRTGMAIKPGTEAFFKLQDAARQRVEDEYAVYLPEREAANLERTRDRSGDKYGAEPALVALHDQLNELRAEKRLLSPAKRSSTRKTSTLKGDDSAPQSRKTSSTQKASTMGD